MDILDKLIEFERNRRKALKPLSPACPSLARGPHESDIRHQEKIDEERRILNEVYCKEKEKTNV